MNKPDIKYFQKRVAKVSLGNAALRNQGAKGVTEMARKFLGEVDLNIFKNMNKAEFQKELERLTKELEEELPSQPPKWGTARKAMNVFLLQAALDKKLSNIYELDGIIPFLEVPLDSKVSEKLREEAKGTELPGWKGIKKLKKEDSKKFQDFAFKKAKEEKIPRVYLDLLYW